MSNKTIIVLLVAALVGGCSTGRERHRHVPDGSHVSHVWMPRGGYHVDARGRRYYDEGGRRHYFDGKRWYYDDRGRRYYFDGKRWYYEEKGRRHYIEQRRR